MQRNNPENSTNSQELVQLMDITNQQLDILLKYLASYVINHTFFDPTSQTQIDYETSIQSMRNDLAHIHAIFARENQKRRLDRN